MLDATRGLYSLHGFKDCAQDRSLTLLVAGPAHRSAERILNRREARYTHGCRQIGDVGQRDGGDPGRLYRPLCQSHGPAADRSGRDQQDNVHLLLVEAANDLRHALLK
jgi:hypothetical protein